MRRLLILAGSTLLAIVALELGLRIAAALQTDTRPAPAADGRPVVVFVGDSNVWGLNVTPAEALPAQCESLSRECAPPGFQAVNRGRRGTPSWYALDEARSALARFRPVAIVVRVGVNNRVLVAPDDASWLDRLRIARLAGMAVRNWKDRVEPARAPVTAATGLEELRWEHGEGGARMLSDALDGGDSRAI